MTRLALVFVLFVLFFSNTNAQNTTFEKGDIEISTGVGIIPTFFADKSKTLVPPLSLKVGYRLSDHISLGAYAAYSSSETGQIELPDASIVQYQNDFMILGLRGEAHTNRSDNWDIYGGLMIGYNIPQVTENRTFLPDGDAGPADITPSFTRPAESAFTYSGFIGGSYYFGKNLGVFAEIGYGISLLNVGMNFKI